MFDSCVWSKDDAECVIVASFLNSQFKPTYGEVPSYFNISTHSTKVEVSRADYSWPFPLHASII